MISNPGPNPGNYCCGHIKDHLVRPVLISKLEGDFHRLTEHNWVNKLIKNEWILDGKPRNSMQEWMELPAVSWRDKQRRGYVCERRPSDSIVLSRKMFQWQCRSKNPNRKLFQWTTVTFICISRHCSSNKGTREMEYILWLQSRFVICLLMKNLLFRRLVSFVNSSSINCIFVKWILNILYIHNL